MMSPSPGRAACWHCLLSGHFSGAQSLRVLGAPSALPRLPALEHSWSRNARGDSRPAEQMSSAPAGNKQLEQAEV